MNAIELDRLTKSYGKSRGIVDVSLSIAEGEFFGFIGPNGAGKSTAIRTLLGLLRADSGTAKIFGSDTASADKKKLLCETGYLPAEAAFYSGMRVKDIIKFSASMLKTDCRKTAQNLCERLSLDTSKKVQELSLGNRRKLGIVCALQSNPRLCILDEPTSGLDPFIQKEFFSILKELHARGTAIFLSSHVLSEIQQYCTRAAMIREGRIIACSSIEELSKTNAKKIHIQTDADIRTDALSGIRSVQKTAAGFTFLYSGSMHGLLCYLSAQPVRDLTITEPSLEEIFMHYYYDIQNEKSESETRTYDHHPS